ncbi:hypothetical protein U1Q18_041702 [Sarracenia purpurea var. burkii]
MILTVFDKAQSVSDDFERSDSTTTSGINYKIILGFDLVRCGAGTIGDRKKFGACLENLLHTRRINHRAQWKVWFPAEIKEFRTVFGILN